MNCESLQTLLDHSELNAISDSERRAVQSHIESCPDCAAVLGVHDEFLAMRIPSVPADLEKRCCERIASVPDVRTSRRRAGPFVLGSLVIAAAAAIVGPTWFAADDEAGVAEDAARSDSTSVQSTADAGTGLGDPDSDSLNVVDVTATSATASSTSAGTFTVELTRLVEVDQTQLSQLFGDRFHAALVEELRRVPNLVLIEAAGNVEVPSIPFDDSSTAEFPFDRNTTTWPGDYDIRLAAGASVGDDWVGERYAVVSAEGKYWTSTSSRDAMRPSVEASPEYAAVLAAEVVEDLQIRLFPADASSLASQFTGYETILNDVAADVTERITALSAAEELARRANDPDITTRLVDAALAFAGQIEGALMNSRFARITSRATATQLAALRTQFADAPAGILQFLSGSGDPRVIGPMSEALLYARSEEVRRVAAGILGEFVDDAVARATLEFAVEFDASAEVRDTAGNYLLDDSVHLEGVFAVVRDSSLADLERLNSILYGEIWQFVEPGFSVDADTVDVIADLIKRSDVATRRDALVGLSWRRSPSFVPVYLERLRNDPSPDVRTDLLRILNEYRSLPDVNIALEATAADDPADIVRAEAARILNDGSP